MKKLLVIVLSVLCLYGCTEKQADELSGIKRDEIIFALLDTGVSTAVIKSETLMSGQNYVTGTDDTEDRINHGTAVAGVILGCESAEITGVAPNTALVPIVVTDKINGETVSVTSEVLAQAIRDSVDRYGASIINVSLGIKKDDAAVRDAVTYVQGKGALVISSAGNDGDSTDLYYPAAYEGVLTVGSHDKNFKVSGFTQKNGTVDILAPGEDIWLVSRNGKPYGTKGTSYASGYVSAAAALVWQNDLLLAGDEIMQIVLESARTVDDWRILDITAALESQARTAKQVHR